MALVNPGDCFHIVVRRNFAQEIRRHFVGRVEEVADTVVRITGYAFIYDVGRTAYTSKPELRTKILDLAADRYLVNKIPQSTNLEAVTYQTNNSGEMVCTDGNDFSLCVNEFSASR